jgi:glycosyltransferase involved in cell wall biosynthesis
MPTPVASVVIACYNYGHFVAESVQSALDQTLGDLEVIVVNDASTDNTADVVKRIRDPRVVYIEHQRNRGVAEAMTTGIRAARGKYVSHMDADDRYRQDYLAETIPIFEQRPDVGLVYADLASMNEAGQVLEDPWSGMRTHEVHHGRDWVGDEFLLNLEDNVIPAPTAIARREAWLEALPFPDWFHHTSIWDWYLHLTIARRHLIYYRAKTLSDYRLHGHNMHKVKVEDRTAEETMIRVLDQMMSGDDRVQAKRHIRNRLYGRAYSMAATRYFESHLNADARRCFLKALRYYPPVVLRPAPLRQLAATILSRRAYDQVKRALTRAA